ncbi:MAG: alpha/beta fold hydrolase [Desulfovibrio sp.]|nr:alpha/beta fold hydrolase [Desulfovibrio sp.]
MANSQDQPLPNEKVANIQGSVGKLFGLLALPDLESSEKCPMVILCHGLKGNLNYHLWPMIIQVLNAKGIGTLRFDFNGCGKSEGEFQNMTAPNEIDDLYSVISWVQSLPSTKNISLVGHSQGGVVAGMAAGVCGAEQIARLVLLSAAAVIRDDALRGDTQGTKYDPWHLDKPWYPLNEPFKLGRSYIQTAMNLPIYETTAKYKGSTLIMNGMADQVVPYTYAERYHEALTNSRLIIVPGENHPWTVNPRYAVDLVTDWLVAELIDTPAAP